jgi:hypothetical protein
VEYTYDSKGRLVLRRRNDKSGTEEKKYIYSASSDTIRTYSIVQDKKSPQKILSSQKIIRYDANGLILSIEDIDFAIVKQRRKWKVRVSMIREQKYEWK